MVLFGIVGEWRGQWGQQIEGQLDLINAELDECEDKVQLTVFQFSTSKQLEFYPIHCGLMCLAD